MAGGALWDPKAVCSGIGRLNPLQNPTGQCGSQQPVGVPGLRLRLPSPLKELKKIDLILLMEVGSGPETGISFNAGWEAVSALTLHARRRVMRAKMVV